MPQPVKPQSPRKVVQVEDTEPPKFFWEARTCPVDFAFAPSEMLIARPKEMLADSVDLFQDLLVLFESR